MLDFTVVIQVVQELFCLGKFIPWGHDNLCMHSLVMNTFITSQIETKKLRIHVQDKIGKSKCDFICTLGRIENQNFWIFSIPQVGPMDAHKNKHIY